MKEEFELNLSRIWMLISAVALVLPVFLPSSANPQNFLQDVIGTVTLTMYVLSFPASFLTMPVMFLAQLIFGVNPNTIGGMYINLFLLCVLGYAQWFWLVPKLLRNKSEFRMLNLGGRKSEMLLSEAEMSSNIPFCDSEGRTPVERVFREKNESR